MKLGILLFITFSYVQAVTDLNDAKWTGVTIDGDTVMVQLNCRIPLVCRLPFRLRGIDAPEVHSKDECERNRALQAATTLHGLLTSAKKISFRRVGRDKYFRLLGDLLVDGKNPTEILLQMKLAVPYFGRKKQVINWCEFGGGV